MPETILVVGATGMLGEPVARRLAKDGHIVRILSRDLDKAKRMFLETDNGDNDTSNSCTFQVVKGHVEDPESLRIAMEGCTGVHLNLSGGANVETRGAQVVSRMALEMGKGRIRRISTITGATTCEDNAWFPGTRAKLQAEKALKESGVPYTIFRCTMFMESLPRWVHNGRTAYIVGKQPTRWHWVAAEDYANMVARAYSDDAATSANKTFYVYGPVELTMEQALNTYIPTCAPNAYIRHVPFWIMNILSLLPHNEHLRKVVLPWMEYSDKVRELGGETDIAFANQVLGAPVVTVQAWCEAEARRRREAKEVST